MLLSEILKDWPCTVSGSIGMSVRGITERSGNVREGYIFVARKGAKDDGLCHLQEAIESGAIAIVVDRNTTINIKIPDNITIIAVPDGRKFISYVSSKLAGDPSESLTIIAVTGTNGKTTVTHFIGQLLNMCGKQAAVIGTTGIFSNGRKISMEVPEMTTLPAEFLHPLLKGCLHAGMEYVVMEASSLGLSTSRLDHCIIDIGVFLNIGVDHYEEHGSKQSYLSAKKKLASIAKELVVNADDEQCMALVHNSKRPTIYFSETMITDVKATDGLYFTAIPGRHNRMNALAAVTTLSSLGFDRMELLSLCQQLQLPEGRLQRIEESGVTVYIDYAHTPDALHNVLSSLRKECTGGLITVFGCGGDRDHGKRPMMGEVAAAFSTQVIITSDNPRNEDPLRIIYEILMGIDDMSPNIIVEPDRKTAIERAVFEAKDGDVVLIAGKGHEKTQQVGQMFFPFSDSRIAKEALQNKKFEIN
ncbi:UDP-N-acetylmuramoyl-L-alanyl-D-glutamate--2,6-diaminopimelate ligase [Sporosarcina thermotolerans]|uniref:UDP-N-acetylmuramoyl-L-alanyl-D-glutamate--2,6-diaminopimelate ligase n=1 Tax=Sporosarcina thermotolerans TaxID=633404 RepID=A0AAW9A4V9_9BACL|nr:UDP-N-acetylmuramoyl-L-alanyl-D-glutamate--2,6-diaminopimelate ligase [Sporosarcina thermotolerans]MDW0115844.1 UDP-N-acetylmuramoyl-L-alanyl-D-glutamate--2,6-diaminopimelate ligase [Sporosarcina thermotolerans]